jgi:hypothetical protein
MVFNQAEVFEYMVYTYIYILYLTIFLDGVFKQDMVQKGIVISICGRLM